MLRHKSLSLSIVRDDRFADLRALIQQPPRSFSPVPLWWWSGAEATPERLAWQLREFHDAGIYNLVVINLAPAGPAFNAPADDPAWFSETWWERFSEVCELSAELGIRIWFYDQIGFSGANVQGAVTRDRPESAGRSLRFERRHTQAGAVAGSAGEILAVYLPDGRRLSDAAVGALSDGSAVDVAYTVPSAFDYLEPAAVGRLIDRIHGEFERRLPQHLGTVIAGSFQDELPALNTWTTRFPEEFRASRGYDILDVLPALWGRQDPQARKIRGDYHAVRTELAETAFFRPLADWHEQRGLLLGCDQADPARAGNPVQATQLYGDYIRTHRWFSAGGGDHEGDSKFQSSIAHLYGHDRVWLEAFHSSGWGGTLEDTYDWLLPHLRSGATLYAPHASYVGTRGGWFEWAPPSTDWRQPYWGQYRLFADAIARITSIMSTGQFHAEAAVLHPTSTAQAVLTLDLPVDHFGDGVVGGAAQDADDAQRHYLELCGANTWSHTRLGALDTAGVAFDVIDDDSVQRAEVQDGRLEIAGLSYATVIVPANIVMEDATAARLIEYAGAGGRVVLVGNLPAIAAGLRGDDSIIHRLAVHPGVARVDHASAAAALIPPAERYACADVPLLVRRDGDVTVALMVGAFPNASGHPLRKDDRWWWDDYDFDRTRYARSQTIHVDGPVGAAEAWNPATGKQHAVIVANVDRRAELTVDQAGAPALIVFWSHDEAALGAVLSKDDAGHAATTVGLTDWTGRLIPTMDDQWGDFGRDASLSSSVPVWALRWTDPVTGAMQDVEATFGERVMLSPATPTGAQAPLSVERVEAILRGEADVSEPGWTAQSYSSTRGMRRTDGGKLGNKGLVAEEFIQLPIPQASESVHLRTVLTHISRGRREIVVGVGADVSVRWNGVALEARDAEYLTTFAVDNTAPMAVLEIEITNVTNHPDFADELQSLAAFFAIADVGSFDDRPEFMTAPARSGEVVEVRFVRQIEIPAPAASATLIVGAAIGVEILIDGASFARQEKAEYYESSWGATPVFFSHDLTEVLSVAGVHLIELVGESAVASDVVYVDLAVTSKDGQTTTWVSGDCWETRSGAIVSRSRTHRGHWSELIGAHAMRRIHPLPGAAWLNGDHHTLGRADAVTAGLDATARRQELSFTLPPAAAAFTVPCPHPHTCEVDGRRVALSKDGRYLLDEPVATPSEVVVQVEAPAGVSGGSLLTGPIEVATVEGVFPLGDWRHLGLSAWSGGVSYRTLAPGDWDAPRLDLGAVRGSVRVLVNDVEVGSAFCAPFAFDLPPVARGARIEVQVFNTIAPYYFATTPTRWVFPSQLSSGLIGPVHLSGHAR